MTTPAVQAMIVKLAPSVLHVGGILTEAEQNPQKRLSAATIKRLHGLLADDLRKIEDACAKTKKSEWPEGMPDEDAEKYVQAQQVARLALFTATISLAAESARDAGHDTEVLQALGRALSSAMTGSGVEAKKLKFPPLTSNTPEPIDLELRARLVSLAELVEDDLTELRRLYDAAVECGLGRKQAQQIVANARGGKLKDDTFLQLRQYWKPRLETEMRAGKKASELLCPQ